VYYTQVLARELSRHKWFALLLAVGVSFSVLYYGLSWGVRYQVSTTFYVNPQLSYSLPGGNEGGVNNSEFLYTLLATDRFSEALARLGTGSDAIHITARGKSRFTVAYTDPDADLAYAVIDGVLEILSRTLAAPGSQESSQLLENVQEQLDLHGRLLDEAERRLQDYRNNSATVEKVEYNARVAELEAKLENARRLYDGVLRRQQTLRNTVLAGGDSQSKSFELIVPPVYPRSPLGLSFIEFALVGPVLGIGLTLLAVMLIVKFDARVRHGKVISHELRLPLLARIPSRHSRSPVWNEKRVNVKFRLLVLLSMAAYASLVAVTLERFSG
jgi:hypothetical protein